MGNSVLAVGSFSGVYWTLTIKCRGQGRRIHDRNVPLKNPPLIQCLTNTQPKVKPTIKRIVPWNIPTITLILIGNKKTIKTIVDVDFQGILYHIITPPKTFAKLHQVNRNKTTPIKKRCTRKFSAQSDGRESHHLSYYGICQDRLSWCTPHTSYWTDLAIHELHAIPWSKWCWEYRLLQQL